MSAFDKIIGYDNIKEELIEFCDMVTSKEKYEKLGARLPQGILIYGEPGLGKTLMAKCVIEECDIMSFTLRRNKGNDDFVANISETFKTAKEHAPSIIFLDDLDKFANEDKNHRDAAEYVAVQAGIDDVKGSDVFVIATANKVWKLPDSLVRVGRFDIQIEVEDPTESDAEAIIKHYLRDKPLARDVDMDDLSKMISYSSCAELEDILNKAAISAASKGKESIQMCDLVKAVLKTQYHLPDEFLDDSTEESRKVALHEAGHVVMCEYLNPGMVGLTSIVATGRCDLHGFVHQCKSLKSWEGDILVSLAGKAAVELYYSDSCTIGCKDDLERAHLCIREHMSEEGSLGFGVLNVGSERDLETSQSYLARSEAVTHAELEKYMNRVRRILLENRAFLDDVTRELLDKGTLLHSDIKRIREKYVSGDDNSPRRTEFGTKLS